MNLSYLPIIKVRGYEMLEKIMRSRFTRTEMLFGREAMERLARARVAVFGIGGVGSYTAESLARAGVGALDLIDDDRVCITNINRQLFATVETVGQYKVDAAIARIAQVNPDCVVRAHKVYYMPDTKDLFDFSQYDYIVDAIDTVTGKIELACNAMATGTPIISSMGAGNKVDPTAFEITDLYNTSVCPLARVMRRELKQRGIKHLKVVYSKEPPIKPQKETEKNCEIDDASLNDTRAKVAVRRNIPGSNSFVPPVVGLIISGEVIKDLIRFQRDSD